MKELFTMLPDPRFHLVSNVRDRFGMAPEPSLVRLNREGFKLEEGVRKKTLVHPYMRLGTHPDPGKGDLFAPIFGEITEVSERSVFVKRIEPTEELLEAFNAVPETDILALEERGEALRPILKGLGLNTKSLGQSCETLIVNGLNPDPGVTWAEPMLLTHTKTFLAGMTMLRRLSGAKRIVLAAPQELKLKYHDIEVVGVPARYPASVNALVVKAVTGVEHPDDVGIVGVHNVWSLGRVASEKKPLIETVITVGSMSSTGNWIVRDGSTLGELLSFAGIELHSGDTIVRGGPLRGESVEKLDRSVTKGSMGVFLVEKGSIPPMEGHSPCVSCGSCVAICPARLRPDVLSRYAEFGLHERCYEQYITSCLECGLCGYVCIARRPVLQYIRLAKAKLGLGMLKTSGLYAPDPRRAAKEKAEGEAGKDAGNEAGANAGDKTSEAQS